MAAINIYTSWEMLGLKTHKLESRFLGEISITALCRWYVDDTTLMAESEEELKSLLRVKEKSEKAGLKLNMKTKIIASGPITSWQIDGEKEALIGFVFLGSKITADSDCSHEIKRHLLLRRKAMTNLDSILKRRDIILPTKVHIVKAMVFSVVM